jgi:hypothetical protein
VTVSLIFFGIFLARAAKISTSHHPAQTILHDRTMVKKPLHIIDHISKTTRANKIPS